MYSSTACPRSLFLDEGLMLVLKKAVIIEYTRLSSESGKQKVRKKILFLFLYIILVHSNYSFAKNDSLISAKISKAKIALEKAPQNLDLKYKLAELYNQSKRYPDVIKVLEPEYKKLDGKNLDLLISSYLQIKNFDQCDIILKYFLTLAGASEQVLVLKAKVLISRFEHTKETRFLDQALAQLKTTTVSFPESIAAYDIWLSTLDKYMPRSHTEAITVLDKLMELSKKRGDSPLVYAKYEGALCKWHLGAGYIQKAVETCESSVKFDKKNPELMLNLARAHLMNGDAEKYTTISQKAASRFPQSIPVQRHLSYVYKSEGDNEKALETALKAYDVDKKDPATLILIAELAFNLKNYDLALKAYTRTCFYTKVLPEEFRFSSGVLRDQPDWQNLFRNHMLTCTQKVYGDF